MLRTSGTLFALGLFAGMVIFISGLDLTYKSSYSQVSVPPNVLANLTDKSHNWKPFGSTDVSQINGNLTISIVSENAQKIYNRAFLHTKLNSSVNAPLLLNFDYASKHLIYPSNSKPMLVVEIREEKTDEILWTAFLSDTSGKILNDTFLLPSNVLNKPIEFKLYIITQGGPTHSILSIKNFNIAENNNESIDNYLNTKQLLAYSTSLGNNTYESRYDIYGAELNDIKVDESNKGLDVNIRANTNGIMVLELPRDLIDAKKQSNIDSQFLVLVDGKDSVTHEIEHSNTTRVLAIEFEQGTKLIQIYGNLTSG